MRENTNNRQKRNKRCSVQAPCGFDEVRPSFRKSIHSRLSIQNRSQLIESVVAGRLPHT